MPRTNKAQAAFHALWAAQAQARYSGAHTPAAVAAKTEKLRPLFDKVFGLVPPDHRLSGWEYVAMHGEVWLADDWLGERYFDCLFYWGPEEAGLRNRAALGDVAAAATLYEKHCTHAIKVASRRGAQPDAENVAMDGWLKVCARPDYWMARPGYFWAIFKNARLPRVVLPLDPGMALPLADPLEPWRARQIAEAVHALTPDSRALLALRAAGVTLADVGLILGVRLAAAWARVQFAIAELREMLADRGIDEFGPSDEEALAAALAPRQREWIAELQARVDLADDVKRRCVRHLQAALGVKEGKEK